MNRAQSVGPSAASIVAGGGKSSTAPPAAHTLLTPLKRGTSMPPPKPVGVTSPSADLTPAELLALEKEKKEALAQQQREMAQKAKAAATVAPSSPSHSSIGSGASRGEIAPISSKTNNTVIIGGSSSSGEIGPGGLGGSNLMGSPLIGGGFSNSSSLGGMGSIAPPPSAMDFGSATGSGVLGGQPLSSGLIGGTSLGAPPGNNSFQLDSLLGNTSNQSGGDKWGAIGGGPSQNNSIGGSAALSSGGLWEGEDKRFNPAPIGPRNGGLSNGQSSDVGGVSLFGTNQNGLSNGGSGSSALASMLGIELPTGSGSLREASGSSLFGSSGQAPIGGLDTAPNSNRPSVIGSNPRGGMQPIGAPGGGRAVNNGFSGGVGAIGGGGSNNDVALLQSLLPGVNITSGNTFHQPTQQQPVGVGGLNRTSDLWIGGNHNNNNAGASQDKQQRGNGIW
jgi:hypothetical protein